MVEASLKACSYPTDHALRRGSVGSGTPISDKSDLTGMRRFGGAIHGFCNVWGLYDSYNPEKI